MPRYSRSIFIFRRDLRLIDNTALNAALSSSQEVFACFIFDPKQIEDHPYRSSNALAFMLESLNDLQSEIEKHSGKLYLLHGQAPLVLEALIRELEPQAVFVNKDYSPFSRARDHEFKQICDKHQLAFMQLHDALLLDPEKFSKPDGKPYTVFTPFFKRGSQLEVSKPQPLARGKFLDAPIHLKIVKTKEFVPPDCAAKRVDFGGRARCREILENLQSKANYENERNFPAMAGTTRLSAHNKFGCCSIRETYHSVAGSLGKNHGLIRELYWRDFFTHIAWHFPYVFQGAFHRQYDSLEWSNNEQHFTAWCSGQTGFPFVDAGMRELLATGNMHNRLRMVVASFLVKDLHISWRRGERFFARHLVDYDPAVNNGNWQWAASTGCDAQPYFRIFNPWLQQAKFDSNCFYIKRWVPELTALEAKKIHKLYELASPPLNYPSPIVEHSEAKMTAQEMFEDVRK